VIGVNESCFRHSDRETGRHCTRCGRPACSECLKTASVGSHCFECRKAAAPSTTERVRTAVAMGKPYVTYWLIGINVVMFLVAAPRSGTQIDLATNAIGIDLSGQWYRVVTGAFLHGSVMHLAFNMLVLFQLGSLLERSIGLGRFAGLYAISLFGGSIGALLFADARVITVGASGAIYGLMGAMVVLGRRRGIDVWRSGIGSMLVINIVISLVVPNISIGGHLGGLVTGALVVLVLDPGSRVGEAKLPAPAVVAFVLFSCLVLFVGSLWVADFAVGRL